MAIRAAIRNLRAELSTAWGSSSQIIHSVIHFIASKVVDNWVADWRLGQVNFMEATPHVYGATIIVLVNYHEYITMNSGELYGHNVQLELSFL